VLPKCLQIPCLQAVDVALKPRTDGLRLPTKDELADKIKEALGKSNPNMEIEFTQPIEMRFNASGNPI
jgi:cobalt-zinc-cadmium resistance protein CzcA